MTDAPHIARNLTIRGRVQGVGYRAWFEKKARNTGLSGWVRNKTDGSVEALVCGPAPAVEHITAAAQHGPLLARVDDVTGTDALYDGPATFTTKETA